MTYLNEFPQYERLLAKLSHKALARATAKGVTMEFDELFSEARMTFVTASEKFDPEKGVKFSTYLWTATKNNLNAMISKVMAKQFSTDSIDRPLGDDEGSFHDIISDENCETMDHRLERLETADGLIHQLSLNAKQVVAVLDSPPPELHRELLRTEAFQAHCKSLKVCAAPRSMSVAFVCAALGFTVSETRKIKREFKVIMEEAYGES